MSALPPLSHAPLREDVLAALRGGGMTIEKLIRWTFC
jgi:hypothetical protein